MLLWRLIALRWCFAMKVAPQRGWCCVWVFSRTRAHHSNSYLFAFTTFTALLRVFINGMLFLLVVFLCFVLSFCLFSMHFYFFSYEHRSYYPPDSLCIICLWRILWRLWMQKDKNSCYARAREQRNRKFAFVSVAKSVKMRNDRKERNCSPHLSKKVFPKKFFFSS